MPLYAAHLSSHGVGAVWGEVSVRASDQSRPTLAAASPAEWRAIIDIAVLASGSGTNLQALIDTPGIRPRIKLVLSDRPGAKALTRAVDAGIPTQVVSWSDYSSRSEFSIAVADAVEESGAEGMVLAGFMRILSTEAIARFPGRIINIHPSLLPAFPGVDAVAQALAHGVKVTGVTVHIVDEKVDGGPIIAQRAVPVLPDDTAASLHARIQTEEHHLYPTVVAEFAGGRIGAEAR